MIKVMKPRSRTVNFTVFVSDTFNLFIVMYKQCDRTSLNPFLSDTKTVTSTVRV